MILLLIAGLILLMYLESFLFRKYWDRGLTAQVSFGDTYIHEGESTVLREEIANAKILPIPALELRLVLDKSMSIAGEVKSNAVVTDRLYERDLFSFFGNQRIIRKIPVTAGKRGRYPICELEMIGYDFFYLNSYYKNLIQDAELWVYPARTDTARIRLIMQSISGMTASRQRLYPDPFEFSGIRDYRSGDPMSSINWKASAKAGDFLVNQYDSTTDIRLTILLDLEDPCIYKEFALTEESVRIASSLASALTGSGMAYDFISNSGDDFRMHVKPGAGLIGQLNRYLACTHADENCGALSRMFEKLEFSTDAAQLVVIISKNIPEQGRIADLCLEKHLTSIWVCPHRVGDPPETEETASMSTIRWEVV